MSPVPDVPMPCPECRVRGAEGGARIGNRRNRCTTCNRFNQSVIRMTRTRLKEKYAEEYEIIRFQIERDLYPQVVDEFNARQEVEYQRYEVSGVDKDLTDLVIDLSGEDDQ